ncbi:MAG: hypothetical protein AAGD11_13215 [Planctomycetota bacterium]
MPADQLQTSDAVVFDGTVSVTTAVALGLLFAVVAAWLVWRERQSVGPRWAGVFWLLRMTALGVALWMLAGPVHETVERSTVRQSIAILTDASDSMETVDAPDARDLLRWRAASVKEAQSSAIAHCDSINVAVQVGTLACERAIESLKNHRPAKQLKLAVREASIAATRAGEHCNSLIEALTEDYGDLAERVGRVETLLQGPIERGLDELQDSLNQGRAALVSEMLDSLEALADHFAACGRRASSLTRELAEQLADDDALASDDLYEMTRREKSLNVLDALQQNVLDHLNDDVRIRKFQFDAMLTPIAADRTWSEAASLAGYDADKKKPATDLAAVMQQLSTDRVSESTRLAIVLTDGNHTALTEQAPQEIAAQISDMPIYTVPVGSTTLVRDLRLHRVEAPSTVVEADSGVIDAIVTAVDCDGLATEVTLRHDGREIDRQRVNFTGDRVDRRIQFRVSADQVGWQDYELTVEPFEDEESVANNVAPISWEVVRDKFRVLLADGVSHWEFRYLQQLFRRDEHIECDELLFYPRLRGTGALAANPRLPEHVDDWAVYDVVILGDLSAKHFSTASQKSLNTYVRQRNGHLILLAGRDHMPGEYRDKPLIDLLPVTAASYDSGNEGYTLMLTDEGRLHSALAIEESNQASEAAWLTVYRKQPVFKLSEYSRPKPTARTLLRAVPTTMSVVVDDKATQDSLPAFLCWHQVGSGKVVYLAAAEIWRLRYRARDRRHHRFWGQMIRWITAENLGSGTDLVRLSTDKNRYNPKEPVEVTVWLKDQTGRPLAGQALKIAARTLDEEVESAELVGDLNVAGRYFGTLDNLPPGAYEIAVTGTVVDELMNTSDEDSPIRSMITIDAGDNLEMLDTRCDRTLLEQVSEITGGQVVPPTAIGEVLQLASLSPEVHESVQRTPLWNRWTNLWIVLSCLVTEWIVRKRKGLV